MLNTENELKKNECEDTMRKWVRICPQCNNTISYNYKSIADKLLKTNPPCKSCLNKNKKGVLKKPRINVFCKLCGKLRYVLTSEKEKEKRDFSLCKSCAQKGRYLTGLSRALQGARSGSPYHLLPLAEAGYRDPRTLTGKGPVGRIRRLFAEPDPDRRYRSRYRR